MLKQVILWACIFQMELNDYVYSDTEEHGFDLDISFFRFQC